MATHQTIGPWEGDLINGATETGNLVTLVERSTRFSLMGQTVSKAADEVTRGIGALFQALPPQACPSLTLDGGKEFAQPEALARATMIAAFFAQPHHSWVRGTNENTNGLIRRLHPKQSSLADLGPAELQRNDRYLNDRPRKCLGWQTPREKLTARLGLAPC